MKNGAQVNNKLIQVPVCPEYYNSHDDSSQRATFNSPEKFNFCSNQRPVIGSQLDLLTPLYLHEFQCGNAWRWCRICPNFLFRVTALCLELTRTRKSERASFGIERVFCVARPVFGMQVFSFAFKSDFHALQVPQEKVINAYKQKMLVQKRTQAILNEC